MTPATYSELGRGMRPTSVLRIGSQQAVHAFHFAFENLALFIQSSFTRGHFAQKQVAVRRVFAHQFAARRPLESFRGRFAGFDFRH